jgi:dihydrofolate reductase
MKIKMIFAVNRNLSIGKEGGLPWPHNSIDMKYFKEKTMSHTLITGSNTFSTLPRLEGRTVLVLSTTREGPNVFKSIDAALKEAKLIGDDVMVIGGAEIYAQMLPIADRLLITIVNDSTDGDTKIHNLNLSRFRLMKSETIGSGDLTFLTLERNLPHSVSIETFNESKSLSDYISSYLPKLAS